MTPNYFHHVSLLPNHYPKAAAAGSDGAEGAGGGGGMSAEAAAKIAAEEEKKKAGMNPAQLKKYLKKKVSPLESPRRSQHLNKVNGNRQSVSSRARALNQSMGHRPEPWPIHFLSVSRPQYSVIRHPFF